MKQPKEVKEPNPPILITGDTDQRVRISEAPLPQVAKEKPVNVANQRPSGEPVVLVPR